MEIECANKHRNRNCYIKEEVKDFGFAQSKDASLPTGEGVEFDSVPSNGDHLLKMIRRFCKSLNDKKYYVDTSCGTHIHLEVDKKGKPPLWTCPKSHEHYLLGLI